MDCNVGTAMDSTCIFYFGSFGEPENQCMKNCTRQSDCRDNYICVGITQTVGVCVPAVDGGLPPQIDAGSPATASAGSACTTDEQCGQPIDDGGSFVCIKEQLPDGGPSGFIGGYCEGDCTLAVDDSFCGPGGTCLPTLGPTDGRGPTVAWVCQGKCAFPVPDGGSSAMYDAGVVCRDQYVCNQFNNATFGTCDPNCNNAGAACAQGVCGDAGSCN
jgi:hypothetical protein